MSHPTPTGRSGLLGGGAVSELRADRTTATIRGTSSILRGVARVPDDRTIDGFTAGRVIDRRYRLLEEIGRGGMGRVFSATDLYARRQVALKVMLQTVERRILSREFDSAVRLRHVGLVEVYDFGVVGGCPYFTMELLRGQGLRAAFLAAPTRNRTGLVGQALEALAYLHARGLVHADIKPSNVLVVGDEAHAQVKLLDLGMAIAARLGELGAGGTPAYMAPEVIRGESADGRADLYSLGCVLYELWAGRPPFVAAVATEVLRSHLDRTPPELKTLAPGITHEWAEFIQTLMAKVPALRYRSASDALDGLRRCVDGESASSGWLQSAHVPASIRLVGRDSELEAAVYTVTQALRGPGVALVIDGPEGIGKSRFLTELRVRLQLEEVRCFSPPFVLGAGVGVLMTTLLEALSAQHPSAALIDQQLGTVAAAFDRAVSAGAGAPIEFTGAFDHLAELLRELGRLAPFAVLVDGVEAASDHEARLLRHLAVAVAGAPVALILAVRSGKEVEPQSRAGGIATAGGPWVRMQLHPLSARMTRVFLKATLGEDHPELRARLHEASGGRPAVLLMLLDHLVQRGLLVPVATSWQLTEHGAALDQVIANLDPSGLAAQQLELLTPHERELAGIAASLGEGVTRARLRTAIRLDPDEVDVALGTLLGKRILRSQGGDRFVFRFPAVRQAALRALDPARQRIAHLRCARARLRLDGDADLGHLGELARDLLAGGDQRRGGLLALRASLIAEATGDLANATSLCEAALGGCGPGLHAGLHERLGDLRTRAGDPAGARGAFERALGDAAAPRLLLKAGRAARDAGDLDGARAHLERALRQARHGRSAERRQLAEVLGVTLVLAGADEALEALVAEEIEAARREGDRASEAALERVIGQARLDRGQPDQAVEHLERARQHYVVGGDEVGVAQCLLGTGRARRSMGAEVEARELHVRALEIFERHGLDAEALRCVKELGAIDRGLARWRDSVEWLERLRRACMQGGDELELAGCLDELGAVYRLLGNLRAARTAYEQAAALAQRLDAGDLRLVALVGLAEVFMLLGDGKKARELLTEALDAGKSGAASPRCGALRLLAELDLGERKLEGARALTEQALVEAEAAHDQAALADVHRVRAECALASGDPDDARRHLERAVALARAIGAPFLEARALIAEAQALERLGRTDEGLRAAVEGTRTLEALGAAHELMPAQRVRAALERAAAVGSTLGSHAVLPATPAPPPETTEHAERLSAALRWGLGADLEVVELLVLGEDGTPLVGRPIRTPPGIIARALALPPGDGVEALEIASGADFPGDDGGARAFMARRFSGGDRRPTLIALVLVRLVGEDSFQAAADGLASVPSGRR